MAMAHGYVGEWIYTVDGWMAGREGWMDGRMDGWRECQRVDVDVGEIL